MSAAGAASASLFVRRPLKSTTGTTSGALGAGYYFEGAGLTGGGQFDPIGIYLNTTTGELRYNATFGTASDAVLFAVVNNGIAGGSASLSAAIA